MSLMYRIPSRKISWCLARLNPSIKWLVYKGLRPAHLRSFRPKAHHAGKAERLGIGAGVVGVGGDATELIPGGHAVRELTIGARILCGAVDGDAVLRIHRPIPQGRAARAGDGAGAACDERSGVFRSHALGTSEGA